MSARPGVLTSVPSAACLMCWANERCWGGGLRPVPRFATARQKSPRPGSSKTADGCAIRLQTSYVCHMAQKQQSFGEGQCAVHLRAGLCLRASNVHTAWYARLRYTVSLPRSNSCLHLHHCPTDIRSHGHHKQVMSGPYPKSAPSRTRARQTGSAPHRDSPSIQAHP